MSLGGMALQWEAWKRMAPGMDLEGGGWRTVAGSMCLAGRVQIMCPPSIPYSRHFPSIMSSAISLISVVLRVSIIARSQTPAFQRRRHNPALASATLLSPPLMHSLEHLCHRPRSCLAPPTVQQQAHLMFHISARAVTPVLISATLPTTQATWFDTGMWTPLLLQLTMYYLVLWNINFYPLLCSL
jgi:hypothetical protein